MKNKILNYLLAASLLFPTIKSNSDSYHSETLQQKISEIDDKVVPTSGSTLPRGIEGFLNPGTQNGEGRQGFYNADLPSGLSEFVRQHELAHAYYNLDGSARGEYMADAIAAERSGKFYYMRGLIDRSIKL